MPARSPRRDPKRASGHDAGHRRTAQAAMEARLGHALGCARRRLRNGRQGPRSTAESGQICEVLGGSPPEGFNYELFLDEKGQKISKSRGNGLTIDEWLSYARAGKPVAVHVSRAPSSQAAVLRRHPAHCRRVSAIRRRLCQRQDRSQRLANPVWHIHAGAPPAAESARSPSRCCSISCRRFPCRDPKTMWGFINRYRPGLTPQTHPAGPARRYAITISATRAPAKHDREPSADERSALFDLREALSQSRRHERRANSGGRLRGRPTRTVLDRSGKIKTKDGKPGVSLEWFNMLYEVLSASRKDRVLAPSWRSMELTTRPL